MKIIFHKLTPIQNKLYQQQQDQIQVILMFQNITNLVRVEINRTFLMPILRIHNVQFQNKVRKI